MSLSVTLFTRVAEVGATTDVMRAFITPLMISLGGLATLVATFFLVMAGIQYMTSEGKPDKLEQAKRVMRNALIGLVIVLAAGTLTAILLHAYGTAGGTNVETIPILNTVDVKEPGYGVVDLLIKAITGLFQHIVESAGKPFIASLNYFTKETSLMAQNASVFKLWLTTLSIANVLFVLVVALLGFHVMSAASLGFDEIEFKHMAPQLIVTFLLMNTSIFLIDMVISLSNVMIKAVEAAFSSVDVWQVLSKIVDGSVSLGIVALIIMVVFLSLSVILLVYYLMRLVTLYIGAVMAPLIILLSILPGFKDFALTAVKAYVTTIFVLFIHVIILQLAASLFGSTINITGDGQPNVLMAMLLGIATLITLLKTQGVLMQMSYVSAGPRALRKLGGQFMTGLSYTTKVRTINIKQTAKGAK